MHPSAFRSAIARPEVQDGALGIGLLLVAVLPLGIPGTVLGALDGPSTGPIVILLQAAQALPLVLRRRAPRVAMFVVGAAFCIAEITGTTTGAAGVALPIALYSVGAHGRRPWITAGVIGAMYLALALTLLALGSPEPPLGFATFAAVLALPWTIGRFVALRQASQAGRVHQAEADAVRKERVLLARDLHDVVTHHVTAMVVQAESAAFLPADERAARDETLAGIGRTGREALGELRELLGALHAEGAGAPMQPTVSAAIDQFVTRLREAGHQVEVHEDVPEPVLSADAAAALRRVAQEAATNALKHAPRTPVQVEYFREGDSAVLRVTNALGRARKPLSSDGRGLAGSAARIEQVGGSFRAGPTSDGRFVVEARLPEAVW
ncbi:sensor histidine kinase [Microbacterium jiangjiandongii]|uniref:sensor histidine kinase n=1 Tax=Microbacterium jiangjiandongii TaxID=3049071 RepID=UPI00214AAA94|nr:histidine kinase [Microbacterium sp. zg.Y843]MCR2815008.1 histidine kinase [Microbacterium sp. zg.Y843]